MALSKNGVNSVKSVKRVKPSLEGGSVEDPSLEEDCGPSGGECLVSFSILPPKNTLFSLLSATRQDPASPWGKPIT